MQNEDQSLLEIACGIAAFFLFFATLIFVIAI
jgi:hypothetical protein